MGGGTLNTCESRRWRAMALNEGVGEPKRGVMRCFTQARGFRPVGVGVALSRRGVALAVLASLVLLGPAAIRAEADWSQLRIGLTADETIAALGRPMLRTTGRGFETWTYDNGAEVLLYDSVVGWTKPAGLAAADRSDDVWRGVSPRSYFPTFAALLPQRREAIVEPAKPARAPGPTTRTYRLPNQVNRRR